MSAEADRKMNIFKVYVYALAAASVMTAAVFSIISQGEQGAAGAFVPYENAATAVVIREDFPEWELSDSAAIQHDGTQFYVMAKNVFDMEGGGSNLDRPEYRWQRPMFAWLASVGYFLGGPQGLIVAFFALNVFVLFAGGVFTGLVSLKLGGSPVAAIMFALLPGAFYSVALAVADALALMLFIAGLHFWLRKRYVAAGVLFAAASLSKETILVAIGGFLLGVAVYQMRRHGNLSAAIKDSIRPVVIPALIPVSFTAGWWLFVRYGLDFNVTSPQQIDLTLPFGNFIQTFELWGRDPYGYAHSMGTWAITLSLLVFVAAKRRFLHPLGAPAYISTLYLVVVSANVLALSTGSTRALYPALLLLVLAALTPRATYDSVLDTDVNALRAEVRGGP